ncbi:MAG: hypothetical protein OXU36_20340 [Candidatus Poribacteria bacterium]|nr:hypothetical protein [Candidatus Poribacteria bacterium]
MSVSKYLNQNTAPFFCRRDFQSRLDWEEGRDSEIAPTEENRDSEIAPTAS